MTSSLWTLPLLIALATTAPAGGPQPVKKKAYAGDALPTAKPEVRVRLRMSLKMLHTTDAAEAGVGWPPNGLDVWSVFNSEDEIYYTIAALPQGNDSAVIKTIRPSGSPDVWEMGPRSLIKQQRTLYQGKLTADERAYFAVAIGEQDNAQIAALAVLLGDLGGIIDALDAPTGYANLPASFGPAARAAVERIRDKGDDVIGAFVVTVGGGRKLEVAGTAATHVKILSSSTTEVTAELNGAGARYRVRLWVEDSDLAHAIGTQVVGKTDDDCGENDVWVNSDGKQILLKKGETKDMPLGPGSFKWFCDGSEESASADAGTEVLSARRLPSGSHIDWVFYERHTVMPDFTD